MSISRLSEPGLPDNKSNSSSINNNNNSNSIEEAGLTADKVNTEGSSIKIDSISTAKHRRTSTNGSSISPSSISGNIKRNKQIPLNSLSDLSITEKSTRQTTATASSSSSSTHTTLQKIALKFSLKYSSFVNKLKTIADQCLDSDEITDQLFDNTDSESTTSSSEVIYPAANTTNPVVVNNTTSNSDTPPIMDETISSTTNTSVTNTLQQPFSGGQDLWELQNNEWLTPSAEVDSNQGKLALSKRLLEQELRHYVTPKDYHIVYKNLVMNNKSLKRPINLKDLLKVIESGWHYNQVFEKAAQSAKENQQTQQ